MATSAVVESLNLAVSTLENYGDHHGWCDSSPSAPSRKCNCGFTDIVRDLQIRRRAAEMAEQAFPSAERIDSIPSHKSPPDDGITYLKIDRLPYRVSVAQYTGTEVRAFAHPPIGSERDLWLVRPGDDDQLIANDDLLVIRNSGFRFYTTPKYINGGA